MLLATEGDAEAWMNRACLHGSRHMTAKIWYNTHQQFKTLRSTHRFGSGETWKVCCESQNREECAHRAYLLPWLLTGQFQGLTRNAAEIAPSFFARERNEGKGEICMARQDSGIKERPQKWSSWAFSPIGLCWRCICSCSACSIKAI